MVAALHVVGSMPVVVMCIVRVALATEDNLMAERNTATVAIQATVRNLVAVFNTAVATLVAMAVLGTMHKVVVVKAALDTVHMLVDVAVLEATAQSN